MQQKIVQIKTVKYWKNKNLLFLVNELGNMQIVGVNLIKHALEIPYTKKDGTFVSKEDIVKRKQSPKSSYSQNRNSFKNNSSVQNVNSFGQAPAIDSDFAGPFYQNQ